MSRSVFIACFLMLLSGSAFGESQKPRSFLPQLIAMKDVEVKVGTPLSLRLKLLPGWKVSSKAPSQLNVFEKKGEQNFELSRVFKTRELEKLTLDLPSLQPGSEYRVQGIFYTCKSGVGAVCVVESRDFSLKGVSLGSAVDHVDILLKSSENRSSSQ